MAFPSQTAITEALAAALLGQAGVPVPIGALIIGSIFPSGGLPSYFTEVYAEITRIVNQALTQNDIDEIDGQLNGVIAYVQNTYSVFKGDPKTPRPTLLADITIQADAMLPIMGMLMQERLAQPGFPVFLLAASVHLSLIQEQALNDTTVTKPIDSDYVKNLEKTLESYRDFAFNTWVAVHNARVSAVTLHRAMSTYWWRDTVADLNGGESQSRDATTADLMARKRAVSEELNANLGNYPKVMDSWRALWSSPIPPAPTPARKRARRAVSRR